MSIPKAKHSEGEIRHVELGKGIVKKPRHPLHKPVFTSNKLSMVGFTVAGIESELNCTEYQWPIFVAKELMDNPYDWFNEYYPNSPKEDRKIGLCVWPIDGFGIRIAVRNSNVDNIPVFEDLKSTFDFAISYSSKRNQNKGGTGDQGDALKRLLKMGYASWASEYNFTDSFVDKQWEQPIILTFNGKQYTAVLHVDQHTQDARVIINQNHDAKIDIGNYNEISAALPVPHHDLTCHRIKLYYNSYKIPKRQIEFSFCGEYRDE